MKTILFSTALVLAFSSAPASARSCQQIAQGCLDIAIKGGYNKAEWKQKCFEADRMAACKKTKKYNAPSGKVFDAD
ncbi:MAG: hypothetical protein NTU64_12905 [Hyphomicrobiales bacterium]|nr:hypothetical protein [Hyphomicrobiales bacterium]